MWITKSYWTLLTDTVTTQYQHHVRGVVEKELTAVVWLLLLLLLVFLPFLKKSLQQLRVWLRRLFKNYQSSEQASLWQEDKNAAALSRRGMRRRVRKVRSHRRSFFAAMFVCLCLHSSLLGDKFLASKCVACWSAFLLTSSAYHVITHRLR